MRHVAKTGDCWLWTGHVNRGGYGMFNAEAGRTRVAHRQSYEIFVGLIPEGLQLDHLCRNRRCVNPAHLEPVTAAENTARGLNAKRTACPRGHDYTPENIYVNRLGAQVCRECQLWSRRRYNRRIRAQRIAQGMKARSLRAPEGSDVATA